MKNYNALRVIEKPLSDLPMICGNMKNKGEVIQHLEGIARRAAQMAEYISDREAGHDHKTALKDLNRAGRIVHTKAFGFNEYHDVTF